MEDTIQATIDKVIQEHSTTEISFIIEELRKHVTQNALTREVAERANRTLGNYLTQQSIDRAVYYGITHAGQYGA